MSVIWLSLLHYFTAFTGFLAYVFILFRRIKISAADFFFLLGLATLLILQFGTKGSLVATQDARFFWGWVIFYFIFKARCISRKNLQTVIVLLCIYSLFEMVLINTVIHASALPNAPRLPSGCISSQYDPDVFQPYYCYSPHFISVGSYQRPFSFGTSPSVSSALLVVLMALCNIRGWQFWLSGITVISFLSGSGMIIFGVLLLVRYGRLFCKAMLPIALIILAVYWYFPGWGLSVINRITQKVGPDYLMTNFDQKWLDVFTVLRQLEGYAFLVGYSRELGGSLGGDFAFLNFFLLNGFMGLSLLLGIICSCANKTNRFPIVLILAATLHYPSMFYLPGQMIFGLLLSIDKKGLPDSNRVIR